MEFTLKYFAYCPTDGAIKFTVFGDGKEVGSMVVTVDNEWQLELEDATSLSEANEVPLDQWRWKIIKAVSQDPAAVVASLGFLHAHKKANNLSNADVEKMKQRGREQLRRYGMPNLASM